VSEVHTFTAEGNEIGRWIVDWSGFEPEASGLQNRRSSGLIYQPTGREGGHLVIAFPRSRTGKGRGARTADCLTATNDFYPAPVRTS
jgi:hypothetical protein